MDELERRDLNTAMVTLCIGAAWVRQRSSSGFEVAWVALTAAATSRWGREEGFCRTGRSSPFLGRSAPSEGTVGR